MNFLSLIECDLIDLAISLEERGGSSSNIAQSGITAGTRAVEEAKRVPGIDRLKIVLPDILNTLREGGWDGESKLHAKVFTSESNIPGREIVLHGAIADCRIYAPATHPNAEKASSIYPSDNWNNSVTFFNTDKCVVAEIHYITDGQAQPAKKELIDILIQYGCEVQTDD